MRVVDTSTWIEWIGDGSMADAVSPHMPHPEDWVVPTIVLLEMMKVLRRQSELEIIKQIKTLVETCILAPLDAEIAHLAAEISVKHKLATADAIIYATALHYGADLLTCDAHFKGLEGVIYIAKLSQ